MPLVLLSGTVHWFCGRTVLVLLDPLPARSMSSWYDFQEIPAAWSSPLRLWPLLTLLG